MNLSLTDYLAIYGAVLSTLVFIWSVAKSHPKCRVKLIGGITEDNQIGVFINIQNPSDKTIHINVVGVLYQWKKANIRDKITHCLKTRRIPRRVGWVYTQLEYVGVDNKCPAEIQPGKNHEVFIPEGAVKELLKDACSNKLIAFTQDPLWNSCYSSIHQI